MAGNMVFAVSEDSVNFDNGWQTSAPIVSNALPIALLWLQQTLRQGNWQNDAILQSSKSLLRLRRSILQQSLRAKRPTAPSFDINDSVELFNQFRLSIVRGGSGDLFDFSAPGEEMLALPGHYLLYIKSANTKQDMAFGFKFTRDKGNYFFDPNAGLFRYTRVEDLLLSLTYLNTTMYYDFLGGQYWFRQVIPG
ncbi:MAG: hypothetical protein OEY52_11645 [Gammaproteobacteria bacterium]|nr:hypothetical protein [Gammaproteobacteria bacterium]